MKIYNEKNFYYKNTIVQAYYYEDSPGFRVNILNMAMTKYVPLHFERMPSMGMFWVVVKKAVNSVKK